MFDFILLFAPLQPSHCVGSFVFGFGISFFGGFQHPPVDGHSQASCDFCAALLHDLIPISTSTSLFYFSYCLSLGQTVIYTILGSLCICENWYKFNIFGTRAAFSVGTCCLFTVLTIIPLIRGVQVPGPRVNGGSSGHLLLGVSVTVSSWGLCWAKK